MDEQAAISFLVSLNEPQISQGAAYGFGGGIERTRELMRLLGCPHKPGTVITVTGSKGKGSTSCMLAAILKAGGHRVGLFTGPHLYDYRERIQLNGEMISREEFVGYLRRLKEILDSGALEAAGFVRPTTFECLTAIATHYFSANQVDYAIMEVGIGGRLDAVNVHDADVAVFTNISLEHTATLGDTVAAIAAVKSGILRPNAIAVTADQPDGAMRVLERACREQNARLVRVDREWVARSMETCTEQEGVGQTFSLQRAAPLDGPGAADDAFRDPQTLFVPLLGAHQVTNAALAVATADSLPGVRARLSADRVRQGLSGVVWPGRLEIVQRAPMVVVDGAHNPDSSRKLAQALRSCFRYDKLTVVAGIVYSKDIGGILAELAPVADELVVVGFSHRRSVSPEDLVAALKEMDYRGRLASYPTVAEGLAYALDGAAPTDLVCVTGSMYVVSRARTALLS